ncbi:Carbon-nitrogen hydrolase [Peptoclostridium litorale DSM 5388]|uniref:(R)-stereoselective amidase RamA n=1 Tax=Peptoclostridium litorale DSM 5388 TaxID=1121324 RepID=A0A069RFG9_PEPLI|nr:carbon-nitrogen hydrolase family protein [Peptoclostridium litorale]KDR95756.1 (R)-stereoselective amidase RamA [Peptoclostridium litorale DSM 5388]SIO21949.1 Carbon-nitrogen hydrolase [Peptoclostridium litorale DSM 5388]
MKQGVIRVAGIQCHSLTDRDLNASQARMYISNNAKNSDLIVFPELYSSGYIMEEDYLAKAAEPVQGEFIQQIRECAKENDTAVIMPFLEWDMGQLYNSVAVIDSSGDIVGIKRKSINWKSELGFIQEAPVLDNFEVYEVGGFKIGLLLCYEASFPELSRALANKGADIIVVMAFWGEWALTHWQTQLSARAIDNNVYVVGVNGLMDDITCGNSMIISPNGNVMDVALKVAGTVNATLCKKELEAARKTVPYYSDYMEYISKIQGRLLGYEGDDIGEIV